MRALVTGGTRGIGRAVAQALIARGDEVWTTGRSNDASPDVPKEHHLVADFELHSGVERTRDFIRQVGIDILINNAGINRVAPFLELSEADFDAVQAVNVRAPFLLMQAALPRMLENSFGRIINLSSVWGLKGRSGRAAYAASKFAVRGLTAAVASEMSAAGILVNAVAPGFVDTDLTHQVLGNTGIEEIRRQIPTGRLAQSREVAKVIAWLASEENTYITGQTITVDGGFLDA